MTDDSPDFLQDPRVRAVLDDFTWLEDWESRYAHVIALGKNLQPLEHEERCQANKVQGCASQVWLVIEIEQGSSPVLTFRGDSDAMIVKGLIALLIFLFSGRPAETVLKLNVRGVFEALGLSEHLSPQRSNGLMSMVERLREVARRSLDQA